MFLAIDLPDDVRAAVRDLVHPVEASDATWTRPAGWHITLVWFDRLDDRLVSAVAARVAPVVEHGVGVVEQEPVPLELGGPIVLGRAVALRVAGPRWLFELRQRLVEDLSGALGPRLSTRARDALDRPFRPHVTLARARRGGSAHPLRDALAERWKAPLAWSPTSVALLGSHTGDGPAHYRIRARWPLGAG